MQSSSHQVWSGQIWSGQVCSACASTLQLRGVWGHAPTENFWILGSMRPFWGNTYDAPWRLDDRVSHVWISTLSAHCVVQYRFRPSAYLASHTLCRWGLQDCNRSLARTVSCWKENSREFFFFALSRKFEHVTCVLSWGACVWIRLETP